MPATRPSAHPRPQIGIVCGLQLEADWLDAAWSILAGRVEIVVAGMGPARAAAAARRLAASGVRGLISWGSAAGLDPALAPGTVVLPRRVVSASGAVLEAARSWLLSIDARVSGSVTTDHGQLAVTPGILADRTAKSALREATGAVAADMETAAVGSVALEEGLPWIALRAIADPADEALPAAVLRAVGDDGTVDPAAVLRSAATSPTQLGSLLRLQRHHAAAGRSMRRLAREAGAVLAAPEPAATPTPLREPS